MFFAPLPMSLSHPAKTNMTPSASRGGAEAASHGNSGILSAGSRRDLYLMDKIHPEDPAAAAVRAGKGTGGRGRAGAGSSSTPPPPPRRGGDGRQQPPHPQSIVYPEPGRQGSGDGSSAPQPQSPPREGAGFPGKVRLEPPPDLFILLSSSLPPTEQKNNRLLPSCLS